MDSGHLQQALAEAGVRPDRVTDILLSHAHPDYTGGLLYAQGKSAFAHAAIRLSAFEWAALRADAGRAALVAAISPQMKTFTSGADVLPGISSVSVPGHTPSHVAFEIRSGDAHALHVGDAIHPCVVSVQRPQWLVRYDSDPKLAETSREGLPGRLADSGETVVAPHMPFPGIGHVQRRAGHFEWEPVQS